MKVRKVLAVLFVGFTGLLSGCAETNSQGQQVTKGFTIGKVRQFTTDSGVECIFAKSGYGGGLSCNWAAQGSDR